MKNPDTRVRYTRKALRNALLELLKEKSIDRITVKEICERAELNRGTFYLHYESPIALLREIETEFAAQSTAFLKAFWTEGRQVSFMEALISSVRENTDLYLILLGPNGDPAFLDGQLNSIRAYVLDQWQEEFPQFSREHLDFIYDFVMEGSMRLMRNWLQGGSGITATEFTHRLERLGHHALMAVADFS